MKKLAAFYFFFSFYMVFAQLQSRIDTARIKIGEPIKLQFQLPIQTNDQVVLPTFSDTLSYHIEILQHQLDTLTNSAGKKTLQQTLEITSFEPGQFLIKPIKIIKNNDTLRTQSFQIYVLDVNVDTENPQFAPNKPIMEEYYTWKDYWNRYWIYGIVTLILFIIAIILVVLYIRSKSKGLKSIVKKTPFDEMMDELNSIDKKKYLERNEQKEFYSHLSFALKNYIGRLYHFHGTELLTDELVDEVAKKEEIDEKEVQQLNRFLSDADLVKFAKQTFDVSVGLSYREWIEKFVQQLKPMEIPENKDLNVDEVTGENYRKIKD
ncbi:hypothetical protein QP519_00455 [Weeksella virosa]|uniref:hypothetical protein n=1 Tax=Weeksella virosa TaxID=1014 RepID=UPI002555B4C2|nr:hypothetical protein [Weeksella virosa]MDK7374022.1 hypothetical protein [Weeksella virosa]